MKIKIKKTLNPIERNFSKLIKRKNFYTMDRNERVDDFPQKKIRQILSEITSFDLRTYPNNYLIYKQLSKWLNIDSKNILLTDGAEGALLRFFSVFSEIGNKVIYLKPSFNMYEVYCDIFKLKKYPFKLKLQPKDFFEDLIKFTTKMKPKILCIANPNQPIETIIKTDELKKLCELTNKMKIFLIIDEAYYHFNNTSAQKLVKKFNNLIVVRTFSKAFGLAGLRIGYCISNKKIINYMRIIKPIYEINSTNIKVLSYFLKNLYLMKNYVNEVNESRNYLIKSFRNTRVEIYGKYSNCVLIKYINNRNTKKIYKKLLKNLFLINIIKIKKSYYLRCTLGGISITKKFCKILKNNYRFTH